MVRTRCFMFSNRGFLFPGKMFCHFWDMRCRHFMCSNRGFLFPGKMFCHFWDMRCRHFMSSNRGFFFFENKVCHFGDMHRLVCGKKDRIETLFDYYGAYCHSSAFIFFIHVYINISNNNNCFINAEANAAFYFKRQFIHEASSLQGT